MLEDIGHAFLHCEPEADWLYLIVIVQGIYIVTVLSLGIFVAFMARRCRISCEKKKKTWVSSVDLIVGVQDEEERRASIYKQYEVFDWKCEEQGRAPPKGILRKRKSSRLDQMIDKMRKVGWTESQGQSDSPAVVALRARLERSQEEKEADFMWKVLTYPQLFRSSISPPPSTTRSDSLASQVFRRLSVSDQVSSQQCTTIKKKIFSKKLGGVGRSV